MKHLPGALLIALLSAVNPVSADFMHFAFMFSGAAYDDPNDAAAGGIISFDGSLLANPGLSLWDPSGLYTNYGAHIPGLVTALTVTVTGSTGGNGDGTFTLADFDAVLFDTSLSSLNLNQELVGQPTASLTAVTWGTGDFIDSSDPLQSYTGDFQLFAKAGSAAPTGVSPFQIGTNAGNDDGLQLTSFAPAAAPEPMGLALFGLGLGVLSWVRRRQT